MAIRGWAAGVTNEMTRNVVQRKLFGPPGQQGTGFIPESDIIDVMNSRGMPGAIDYAIIRHQAGGESWLSFKSYEQGRLKFQSDDIDVAWLDEEPPEPIYTETLARTMDREGIVYITATPLLGMTEIVGWYFPEPNSADRHMTQMTIDDAIHIPEERRASEIAKFPKHEREARARGIPMLGSGKVFPVEESFLSEPSPEIPDHWARIVGLDLGYDHPTAAVWLAWDRDADVVHLYDTYMRSEATLAIHAAAIKSRGPWIPVAWPHDAYRHVQDLSSCEKIADIYLGQGVNMLPSHATFEAGGYGLNASVEELLGRMETGRFKVAQHLHEWWAEFMTYHRKEGKIVAKKDDLMSATRYAVMMLRFAESNRPVHYPAQIGMEYDPLNPTKAQQNTDLLLGIGSQGNAAWRH
jgi:phage terminase large subunit-like protein